jgi:hypothetical protein
VNWRYSTCILGAAGFRAAGRALSLLSVSIALGGCLGGQTGTEENAGGGTTKDPAEGGGAACDAHVTRLTPSETSPLGFALDSVLSAVTGARSAPLAWSEDPPELDFGPEHGLGSVELSLVENTVGEPRFVHWTPRALGPDVGGCAPDEVQFDAQVSFVTVGGAFAERFPAVLHVTRPDTTRITLTLALDTLSGAFSVSPAPGVVTKAVVLDAELTAQGTSGTLRGQIEQTLGSVASARSFTYACWPAGNASCVGL